MIGEQRERLLLSRIDQHDRLRDTRAADDATSISHHQKSFAVRRNEMGGLAVHGKSLKDLENNTEAVQ
jgi:hypothetical protein